MARPLTSVAIASLAQDSTGEAWVYLMEIDHADFASPVRFTNNSEDLISSGDTFTALAFDPSLPDEVDRGQQMLQISVCNIDRTLIAALRSFEGRATVSLSIVLASAPDDIVAGPWEYQWISSEWDARVIVMNLGHDPVGLRRFPPHGFTPDLFPGLF